MSTFDKREDGFENKFAHDEELQFKAFARRNKLLGLWAAEKLGKTRRGGGRLRQGAVAEGVSRKPVTTTSSANPQGFRRRRRGAVGTPDPPAPRGIAALWRWTTIKNGR